MYSEAINFAKIISPNANLIFARISYFIPFFRGSVADGVEGEGVDFSLIFVPVSHLVKSS